MAQSRKEFPVATGVLDYFPDAIVAISEVSYHGNQQHNPGTPVHWDRAKSGDEADAMIRHFLQRGTLDNDGLPHTAKMAWRALALLQKELEGAEVAAGAGAARELPATVKEPTGPVEAGDKRPDVKVLNADGSENAEMTDYYRKLGEASARVAARRAAERAAREDGR